MVILKIEDLSGCCSSHLPPNPSIHPVIAQAVQMLHLPCPVFLQLTSEEVSDPGHEHLNGYCNEDQPHQALGCD